jgi:hypothetical protein
MVSQHMVARGRAVNALAGLTLKLRCVKVRIFSMTYAGDSIDSGTLTVTAKLELLVSLGFTRNKRKRWAYSSVRVDAAREGVGHPV